MAELRAIHEELGHTAVATYIQSGNVVFEADTDDAHALSTQIETAIEHRTGLDVAALVRTAEQLATTAAANPFVARGEDAKRIGIAFCAEPPSADAVAAIDQDALLPDEMVVADDVHLFVPNGFGRANITNAFLERALGVTATTRNWNTVSRLVDMSVR